MSQIRRALHSSQSGPKATSHRTLLPWGSRVLPRGFNFKHFLVKLAKWDRTESTKSNLLPKTKPPLCPRAKGQQLRECHCLPVSG